MNVLALEGYYGGSHKAFLDGWIAAGRHRWHLLTLPPYKWKWRMRHSALTFARQIRDDLQQGRTCDLLFCSDMVNLAELRGLLGADAPRVPCVVYFHENQLTYPVRVESERDYQFAMTNLTTALAADAVWFNSAFHQLEFLSALDAFLRRMPDHQPFDAVEAVRAKSLVREPGIQRIPAVIAKGPGTARILWSARWEHDKNPEDFFAALKILREQNVPFRLSVIGEQFRDAPPVFAWAREFFADRIDRWGFQATRQEYITALQEADIAVSTANHEFFGIGMVEAAAAGALPLVPNRLSYPEIFGAEPAFLYDGTVKTLAERLRRLCELKKRGNLWQGDTGRGLRLVEKFYWDRAARRLDAALEAML